MMESPTPDDRPSLRRIAALLARSLAWLGPVRWHVVALLVGVTLLAVALVPPGALLVDVVWTRVLLGQPLTALQASVLRIDPTIAVDVTALPPEVRHAIAVRVVTVWVLLAVPALFLAVGLWYYQIAILQWVNQRLRLALFDRLQSLSLRFHGDARIGDAVYRLFQDSAMVTQVVQVLLLLPLFGVGRFVFSLTIVAAADPRLALVLGVAWPLLAVIGFVATPVLRRAFRRARARTSDLTASIEELLASLRVLKAYGAERWALQRFTQDSTNAFDGVFAARSLLVGVDVLVFVFLGGALIVATAWATLDARDGAPVLATRLLGLAGFAAWNLGCFQFIRNHLGQGTAATHQLWRAWAQAQDVIVGLERAFALLDRAPDVTDAPDAVPFPFVRDGISIRGVTFGYDADRPVLRDVDLLARVDTMTAIMGPTGAGKSTLAALLLRLFDPDLGTITVDGINLRRVQVASLRDRIALVLQEPLLFSASIRENIRYAAPHASDSAVRAAAHVACADDFIERLPAGYDTVIGERGARLSAGERQRIAIARAVLKDTPVVVLDEPTAALDPATEAHVLDRLATWGRGRVVIVITHRLTTARRADQVVLLDEGRVVEAGSQDDLTERPGGAYRALVASELGARA